MYFVVSFSFFFICIFFVSFFFLSAFFFHFTSMTFNLTWLLNPHAHFINAKLPNFLSYALYFPTHKPNFSLTYDLDRVNLNKRKSATQFVFLLIPSFCLDPTDNHDTSTTWPKCPGIFHHSISFPFLLSNKKGL